MIQAKAARAYPPVDAQPILSVRDLRAHYRIDRFGLKREVKAVDGISFAVQRGEMYGLAGEFSSGKTTLLKVS